MITIREEVAKLLARQDDEAAPNVGHYLDADALISAFDIRWKQDTEDHMRCCGAVEAQYTCPETIREEHR